MSILLNEDEYRELRQRAAEMDERIKSERLRLAHDLRQIISHFYAEKGMGAITPTELHCLLRDWEAGLRSGK